MYLFRRWITNIDILFELELEQEQVLTPYDNFLYALKAKETKKWLKGMWNKLKDKAQDQIVDIILSQGKIYGPQLIAFLIRFIPNGS
jgi:hypothetical protein